MKRLLLVVSFFFAAAIATLIILVIAGELNGWHMIVGLFPMFPISFFFFYNITEERKASLMFVTVVPGAVLVYLVARYCGTTGGYLGLGLGFVAGAGYYFAWILPQQYEEED